jgi:hypothetical protein
VPETSDITAKEPIAKNIKLQKYKYRQIVVEHNLEEKKE